MKPPSYRLKFAAPVCDRLLRLRLELLIVVAVGLMAFAPRLADPPLIDWDEATYAEVAHEAVTSGQYLAFTWNGEAYLKKPPLLFWMLIASFNAFGESEWSARLPSVLMGLGTLALIYLAGASAGRLGGVFAALIPLQFYYFVARGGRECATDAPLLFFTMLAFYALLRAVRSRGWVPVVGIACGLAVLSKGPAGLIPLIVAATAVLILPDFGAIGIGGLLLILLETAVIALPWYILQAISNFSLFWSTLVVHETVLRVVSHLEDEPHGAGFTLRTFYAEIRYLWPLLMLVPAVAYANLRRGIGRASRRIRPSTALWMLWLVVALGAACAVQTKLPWYILPALVPVALLSGGILADALTQSGPLRACRAALALVVIAILASGVLRRWQNIAEYLQHQRDLSRPSYVMAVRAQQLAAAHGGGELFFAGVPLPTLVYYSGMRCHFVNGDEKPYELISGNESFPVGIALRDLVLVDPQGEAVAVSNLGHEWMLNGPDAGK